MSICANHPGVRAQWQCLGCGRVLCSDCVTHDPVFSTYRCVSCQGPAMGLTEDSGPMMPEPPQAPPPDQAPWPGAQPPQPPQAPPPPVQHYQAPPPIVSAPQEAPPSSAPPGLVLDDSSMAEAQYDPSRETATSIEALSVSTVNRYASGMDEEGVNLWGEPAVDQTEALRAALEQGDDSAALQSYQDLTGRGQTPSLDAQLEAKLARVLDQAGMPQDAIQACRRIVMNDPQSPLAPGALFTGARLAAGRLGDQQMAARLLQFLIEKYPTSGLVPQAQAALKNIAGHIQRRG